MSKSIANKLKVEYSYGVDNLVTPDFTMSFEQDIGDQYITDWNDFMRFFIEQDETSARMQLFVDRCLQLEEQGLNLLDTDPEKFSQLEAELEKLIILTTP